MRGVRNKALVAVVAAAAGLLGAGSSQGAPTGVVTAAPAAAPAEVPAAAAGCDTRSSLPASRDESGAAVQRIKKAGTLVVGVDQNSYHWGYRDPQTGQIEGFDIDLAHAVAKALLGDPAKVTFKTVPTAQRIQAIQEHKVDLIARTMTITCDRLQQVAFSVPYFSSGQRLVVPRSAHVDKLEDGVRGKRVCAAKQSSSQTELQQNPRGAAAVTLVDNQLDCLVLMQLGQVDATLTDTTLAAAQTAQDPTVEMAGEQIVPAYMGIAMNQKDTDLVARVNQVLADYRAGGGWQASYQRWLAASMGADPAQYLP
ncbi:Putative ABC transporter substrate-binding protein [Kitasatospora sp. MMS16-BH015]|uniref:glutamate ABC transporter substrate-binding protein n=1 Tax=Kitasatospora sp. MMS16-BH015 TaxID=2018025 RepID=UPI000CA28F5D|nr:glutamate ABC transporter substrate-binding protein [Kitasatospora sp. MMS16-BH015]AUG80050.1 Putative ABC transporter substrate-binding protein [Kitasatospora sp. MMS16-BH015]